MAGLEEGDRMGPELVVRGAIVDSWVEHPAPAEAGTRLVLQVAPQGRPHDLLIVQADTSLVPDSEWLRDLGENLCHGSPVAAVGHLDFSGQLRATSLELAR
jgi:hypothetical protein